MAKEGTAARVVRNTLANGLGAASGVAISLVLTPFMIHKLGLQAYGIWVLALSVTFFGGYGALADLGVEGAAVRYVAEARSEGDSEAVNSTISNAMLMFTGIALVVTPPLILLAGVLPGVFSVSPEYHHAATLAFGFLAAQLAVDLPSRAFFAVLEGAQQFAAYQAVLLVRSLVQSGLFLIVLFAHRGIGSLGAVSLISSVVMLVLVWRLAARLLPDLRISPRYVSRAALGRLFGFGGGLLLMRLFGTLYRQMDKVIVGIALGPRAVAVYEVANQIHLGASTAQSVAVSALMPAAAYLRRHRELLQDMYLRGTAYVVGLGMPVTLAAIIFAGPLIRTWIGGSLTRATGPAQLFLLYLTITVFHVVGSTMVVALGRLRFILITVSANLAVNLGLSIALVGPLGIKGVILGTLIAQTLAWPALLWFFLRTFELAFWEWVWRVLPPAIPGLALQAATAVPLIYLAHRATNLPEVGGLALVSVGAGVVGFFAFGLAKAQRQALVTILRQAVGLRAAA